MIPSIGPLEIIVVLVVVLLIFGPKRLPDLGKSLGRGMREFKDSVTGNHGDDDDERKPELAAPVDTRAEAPRSEPAPVPREREPARTSES